MTVMTLPPTIAFQRISPQERSQLFREMEKSQPELIFSQKGGKPLRLAPGKIQNGEIAVALTGKVQAGECLLNFGLDSGVYFLRSSLRIQGTGGFLDFSGEIFKFQRRENFRCPVPASVQTQIKLYPDETSPALTGDFQLRDLSGKGVALRLAPQTNIHLFQPQTTLLMDLQILGRNFKKLQLTVRHLHPEGEPWVGGELVDLSFSQETEMRGAVLDLQRVWFQEYLPEDV